MTTLIGIKNCSTVKKATNWLEERNIPFEFRDVKKVPLSADEMKVLWDHFGESILINRRGMMWRKKGLANQDLDEQELFDVLMETQNMMKRPVVLINQSPMLIGFKEDEFEAQF